MKIICIIPARKNSSRLKNKNTLNFCGKPLFEWTVQISKKIKLFNKIVVSSDDEKILKYKKKYPKIDFLKRPRIISRKSTHMSEVIKYNLQYLKKKNQTFDAIAILQPTSPLRKINTINSALKKFIKYSPNYLASVSEIKHTQYPHMLVNQKNKKFVQNTIILNKNLKKKFYYLDGGVIFIFKIKNSNFNFSKKGAFIKVNFPENIDINTYNDFLLAKKYF
tara:strand:+ start:354 stop:1016 length:663 start_codon:yes stop_codon:yes gene_type:complete